MGFTKELLEKAQNVKNAKELLALAGECGVELTEEDVKKYFDERSKQAELADDELEKISGGQFYDLTDADSADKVTFVHKPGDIVEVSTGWFSTTVRCVITEVRTKSFHLAVKNFLGLPPMAIRYRDEYYCRALDEHWYFSDGWFLRSDLEM